MLLGREQGYVHVWVPANLRRTICFRVRYASWLKALLKLDAGLWVEAAQCMCVF